MAGQLQNEPDAESGRSFLTTPPSVSLPKGGGAVRGIGEKFAANPVTGTGAMSVPIATSPGRSGFGPQLSLAYDSGSGNGPFGFGWSLSLPAITRKTEKGLPRYLDSQESDVFILSGADDLVPVYRQDFDGTWVAGHKGYQRDPERFWVHDQQGRLVIHENELEGHRVRRYRPRIEGLFARIERWTKIDTGDIHWRSITRDNVTTVYGKDNASRIFDAADVDPAHPSRIFSWLICQSYDDKGNAILYEYAKENDDGIDHSHASERNRLRTANRYLKRIKYGNRKPNRELTHWQSTDPILLPNETWMFEVVFDYGDGHYSEAPPDAEGQVFIRSSIDAQQDSRWPVRQDPFSSYRGGFEVRTYRLCRRVLMFHHFPEELGNQDCLVRATEFSYEQTPVASFITSVTQSGYTRRPAQDSPDRYLKRSLPPVEFDYSKVPRSEELTQRPVQEIDAGSLENLPIGLDGVVYQWLDLDGESTYGILTEQADGWYYKRNLSANNWRGDEANQRVAARFGPVELISPKPIASLTAGAQFLDLGGDGQIDLVQMEGPVRGFYERTEDAGWMPFNSFRSWPDVNIHDADLNFVDLTGDGHADILITEGEVLTWYPSLAEQGFGPSVRVSLPSDEEEGPRLVFADGTQSIYLTDLSGDGLSDLARIRNGEICYWPNLGYGRFGAKITMDNPPWFDLVDQFDQRRIRLADTDGSGTTDILYIHHDRVTIYFNQSGNAWSDGVSLPQFPAMDSNSSVQVVDLLGNGTACLVWSSPLPASSCRQMLYLSLMDEKPHLLVGVKNNLGAETRVRYAPSTQYFLDDERAGKPWITKLPFPVHVVQRVESFDHIGRNRFVTRYRYHHGYFDGEEREFRGFGMVEQLDTEEFAALQESGAFGESANLDAASHVPPVLTKTWFHTGAYRGRSRVVRHFEEEYYREPRSTDSQAEEFLLPDTVLPDGLTLEEEQEGCRALKGSMLRQEVYALDGTDKQQHPYTVAEQNFTIRTLQGQRGNRHAVVFTHAREAITFHYERNPADPRIQHALTLEVNDFGDVLKSVAIGYGRRQPDASLPSDGDRKKQALVHITFTETFVTNSIDVADQYRTPLPAEARTYEMRKPWQETSAGGPTRLYRFDDLQAWTSQSGDGKHEIPYEDLTFTRAQQLAASDPTEADKYFRRLIENVHTLYRPDDCGATEDDPFTLLPLRTLKGLALAGESYKLAFTPGLLAEIFRRPPEGEPNEPLLPTPADILEGVDGDQGGYVYRDGGWWIPSGRSFFHPEDVTAAAELAEAQAHFFLPRRYRDPFGKSSTVTLDGPADPAQPRYDLLIVETRDALGNRVSVDANDYRVLQPRIVSDPNRNQTEVAFDTLGLVVGTAVMGKAESTPSDGDSVQDFVPDLTQAQIADFFSQPRQPHPTDFETEAAPIVHALLGNATTRIVYDLGRYQRSGEPPFAATIARETHVSDLRPGQKSKLQVTFSHSDGFGREVQTKMQSEPDRISYADDVLADAPVAYYRLNEPDGAVQATDSSGNGNHGVFSSTGLALRQPNLGAGGAAALFDGSGSGRIVVPDSQRLNPKHITIEALIRWSGPVERTQQRIVEKSFHRGSPTWPTYGLSITPDGSPYIELVIPGASNPVSLTGNAKVKRNVPTHLAATYDGNSIRIYVDGVPDTSLAVAGEIASTFGSSDIGIGNQVERDRAFNGVIDEIALYDKALPVGRIRSHIGKLRPRWVGSGWTIFNNKGKAVRQYEPFFSATHRFEFGITVGVSPVLFYDSVERVVATLRPDHTYAKVVFDPWQKTTYDGNDTIQPSSAGEPPFNPRDDRDVGPYFRRLLDIDYLPTWYDLRTDAAKALDRWPDQDHDGRPLAENERRRASEKNAAEKAAAHSNTPTTVYFDALGRPFLTVAHNRVRCPHHPLNGKPDEDFRSRVEHDIEGNQREVRDERKLPDTEGLPQGSLEERVVMRYAYDMLGNRIYQESMEAAARWMLNDVTGKPIRAWDSRGHNFTTTYDALRRPLNQYVAGTTAESDPRTLNPPDAIGLLVDRIEYGEPRPGAGPTEDIQAQRLNLRTRIYRHLDSVGEVVNSGRNPLSAAMEAYDFKGNLLRTTRRLVKLYDQVPNWSQPTETQLETEFFEASNRYDALNRPSQSVAPHSSLARAEHPNKFNVIQLVFNETNLLDQIHVWLERLAEPADLLDPSTSSPVGVDNIDYDANGRRQRIEYKNGAGAFYDYDPLTFRLTHLLTRRDSTVFPDDCPQPQLAGWPGCQVQNLHYTYDPNGNIIQIRDVAQQAIYFSNQFIESGNEYTYDAVYRLIQATGREHLDQSADPISHSNDDANRMRRPHPNSGNLMARYCERYIYDAVGNFLSMSHHRSCAYAPGWKRAYDYAEASLIEHDKLSNLLSHTTLDPSGANALSVESYQHDSHGNITRMPHLPVMRWNWKDQLLATARQVVTGGLPETTWYVYDARGQRVRKVTMSSALPDQRPKRKEERLYLGGFEIYRAYEADGTTVKLDRETLHVMDDKQRVAVVETRTLGNDAAPRQLIRYQLGNHLGSAVLELNDQAEIISYEEYAPYGSTTYQAVRSQTETAKRYRYTGMERDEETGMSYHGARYYGPWLGRWTSCDPSGLAGGANLFVYANNNPLLFTDPTGTIGEAEQLHLIEQTGLRQLSTATDMGRGYGQGLRNAYQALGSQWMQGPIDVGDPENLPFSITPPGTTRGLFAQRRVENQEIGRNILGPLVGEAREAGETVRNSNGSWPGGNKGTIYGQPPMNPNLQGLDKNVRWHQTSLQLSWEEKEPTSTSGSAPVQLELGLSSPAQKAGSAPSVVTTASAPATPTPSVPTLSKATTATKAASTPATPVTSQPSGTTKNPAAITLSPKINAAGGTGSALIKAAVPGVAETEAGFVGAAYYAAQSPLTVRLVTPLVTASEAVPIAGAGFVAGIAAGHQYEAAAASLGASRTVVIGSGLTGAVLSGAAVGAVIGAPTGIGAPIGAVIGGAAALIGYGISRWAS